MAERRRAAGTLAATVALVLLVLGAPVSAQLLDPDPTTTTTSAPSTTTTAPPESTTTTTEPRGDDTPDLLGGDEPSTTTTTAPPSDGGEPGGGEGTAPPEAGDQPADDGEGSPDPGPGSRTVPPEAQAIIDAYPRTGPSSSAALDRAVQELVDLGLSREEAYRIGFGRFPVAGVARYSHDWLFPRYGPGFRFHLGTDVFAPFGTPLRSPVDGTVTAGTGSLGGLFVKVFMDDGTYFYMAHLSGLPDGFVDGMEVRTGDVVGFVGDSGNARGGSPHLHLGVYPQGGSATDPKPILDQMLADAEAALPAIVADVAAQRAAAGAAASTPEAPRGPRSLLATALLRPLLDERGAGGLSTAVLLETLGNPSAGGLAVAEAEAADLVGRIDWQARAELEQTQRAVLDRVEEVVRLALGPFVAPGASGSTAAGR